MKITLLFTITSLLFTFTDSKTLMESNQEKSTFKNTIEAEYSAKRSSELSREKAFEQGRIITNQYNTKGELISFENKEVDGEYYEKTILEKNSKGTLKKSTRYDKEDNILSYTLTKIEKNGKISEYKSYNAKDELTSIQKNQYDTNGNIILMTRLSLSSNRSFRTVSEYNKKDQLTLQTRFNPDETIKDVRTYEYDDQGNEVLQEINKTNGGYTKIISEYDQNKNLTIQNWYNKDGTQKHQTSFSYIYDEHNNWITKKRYSNKVLGYVWERKIEYY